MGCEDPDGSPVLGQPVHYRRGIATLPSATSVPERKDLMDIQLRCPMCEHVWAERYMRIL